MRSGNTILWTAALLGLAAPAAPARGEVVKKVSVVGIYDNNAFKSSDGTSDLVSQASVYLARRDTSANSGVDYFYSGDLDLFARTNDRHFTSHHVGISYLRQVGRSKNLLSAGWNFGGRLDRPVFNYYDSLDGSLYLNFKMNLPNRTSLRMAYRMNGKKYLNLSASSFREHLFSTSYNASLPTRTAIKTEVTFGFKGYTAPGLLTISPEQAEVVQPLAPPRREMRRGMRMGPFGRPQQRLEEEILAQEPVTIESGSPDKSQITLSLRFSQSLSPSTGVSFQYLTRVNPLMTGRYQSGLGTGYTENDDLFDDRYDYRGNEVSGGFSQLLPFGSKLAIDLGYLVKDYKNKPALDLTGVSTGADRRDRKGYVSAGVEMPLGLTYDLDFAYLYSTNRSNDPFYTYHGNHAFSVGISRDF